MGNTVADVSDDVYNNLKASLLNESGNVPLHERYRTLFTLKSLKSERAVDIIAAGFRDESALLKHELAYCLGQMKRESALIVLESVLRDKSEDPMVRHEAAEAMGAISSISALPVLRELVNDPERAVKETCEIAVAKIIWDHSEEGKQHHALLAEKNEQRFTSVDPAPSCSGFVSKKPVIKEDPDAEVPALRAQLLDTSRSLFDRYRAMFALRDIGTPASVDALSDGFTDDSALFKHEIAFVFGQLLSPYSVPSLLKVLQDSAEDDMVRHEAAEALGGIGTPEVLPHLQEWMKRSDAPRVVRESCQVAIDMWEYENSDQFQYADGLVNAGAVPSAVLASA